ncbi:MAG: hypothetical protein FWE34_02115 [Defluviitaleaceae bacterium]|nr:hypothetical protein [Defluviitaleaceae bacterium]
MNKKFLTKLVWWLSIASAIALFIVPIIINFLFSLSGPNFLSINDWSTSDAISYFGAVLIGAGTIFLGAVVFYHTRDNENANTKRPYFEIPRVYYWVDSFARLWNPMDGAFNHTFNEGNANSFMIFKNGGDGVAHNIQYVGFEPSEGENPFRLTSEGNFDLSFDLKPEVYSRIIHIYYQNIVGYAYSQTVNINVTKEVSKSGELSYNARLYISSQIPLGMNKYNAKTGAYKVK